MIGLAYSCQLQLSMSANTIFSSFKEIYEKIVIGISLCVVIDCDVKLVFDMVKCVKSIKFILVDVLRNDIHTTIFIFHCHIDG